MSAPPTSIAERMEETRLIKRYANRKLYDTRHSRYVTLEQIAEMIRLGDDVKIIDNKSKEDLTSVTLAQIIFEEEKKQKSFLSLQAMRNIIQSGGESITHLVTEAQRKVTKILPRKDLDGHPDSALSDDSEPTSGEQVDAVRKPRDTHRNVLEFREWLLSSQKTIDDWQKRVDERIRNVVEGISPFAGIHGEVKGLATRIAELEEKLSSLADKD